MTLEMLVIKIPETEDGSRIDRCIRRILGNINQAMLEKYLRSGLILLDNKKIKSSVKVNTGQLVKYSSHIKFENGKIKQFNQADINNYYKNLYKRINWVFKISHGLYSCCFIFYNNRIFLCCFCFRCIF